MLLQVQLHARVNEGSITVDAARLVKELEESYARKVSTVGATALTESVRTEPLALPAGSGAFVCISQDSGRVLTRTLGEYFSGGDPVSPLSDHHGPLLTYSPRLLRPLGLPLHGPPITRGHVSPLPANTSTA